MFCGPQHYPDPGAAGCTGWNPASSSPLKVFGPFKSYFSYRSQMTPLVGVSADNACHLYLSSSPPLYYCDQSNYPLVLEQLRLRELNKIRLWVGFGAEIDPLNQPFEQVTVTELGTFWALDQKYDDYFRRLREVVAEARKRGLFVEVTFFAPWQGGDFDRFRLGPWGGAARYGEPGAYGQPVKFTRWANFVQAIPATPPATGFALVEPAMQKAQENVVRWTVQELWCFDNVYWELANEQENYKCKKASGTPPTDPDRCTPLDSATLDRIANWNKLVISWVKSEEDLKGRPLNTRHLIAAQPFSRSGATRALSNSDIAVVNGHYTLVQQDDDPRIDLGAMSLIRERGTPQKILGFNEGKIVQTWLPEETSVGGGPWARTHWNGSSNVNLRWGVAASARAEAWEFMLTQGGAVDHFGYRYDLQNSRALQGQMRNLLRFLRSLRLTELQRSSPPPGTAVPGWLRDCSGSTCVAWPPYPREAVGFDPIRQSQRYWAALEPTPTATKGQFVLYVHRSTQRCKTGDFTNTACSGNPFLSFGGYDARVWTAPLSNRYSEKLELRLGGSGPKTYLVEFCLPAAAASAPLSTKIIHWTPNGTGGGSCPESLVAGKCVVQSDPYDFDLAVRITEQ